MALTIRLLLTIRLKLPFCVVKFSVSCSVDLTSRCGPWVWVMKTVRRLVWTVLVFLSFTRLSRMVSPVIKISVSEHCALILLLTAPSVIGRCRLWTVFSVDRQVVTWSWF